MLKKSASLILKLCGWRVQFTDPGYRKYVLIGAPHTSNWDFPMALLGLASIGIKFNWVAKHTLFWPPLGTIFRSIGGIPVDRSSGAAFLKNMIDLYLERESLVLAIAPEGTRSKTRYWKTGFYALAERAEVPIVMGFVDYQRKLIGVGEVLLPTGDIEHDFSAIQKFYQDKIGKYPELQGAIEIKVRSKKKP